MKILGELFCGSISVNPLNIRVKEVNYLRDQMSLEMPSKTFYLNNAQNITKDDNKFLQSSVLPSMVKSVTLWTLIILFFSSAIVFIFGPFLTRLEYQYIEGNSIDTQDKRSDKKFNSFIQPSVVKVNHPNDSVVVNTNYGQLLGHKIRALDKDISYFLGIPYAKPPVGDLRFAQTVAPESWSGLRHSSQYGPQCFQYKPNKTYSPWISMDDNMSEDCLYLNIWTPAELGSLYLRVKRSRRNIANGLKPVMVWIHGGAYFSGSSDISFYDGRILASFGDVVVVTLNYRLGALGFLNAKIPDAPGNQGLYDQVQALKWIQENIAYFGGDPEEVTLFGQSAGAISVGLHYLSPLSQGLFKRGILQSGVPTVSRIFYDRNDETTNKAVKFAELLNCNVKDGNILSNPDEVLECLKKTNIEDLRRVQEELIEDVSLSFGPTSGDAFLPDNPISLLLDGEVDGSKEVLLGTNKDEGSFFLHFFDPKVFGDKPSNLSYEDSIGFINKSLCFLPSHVSQLIIDMFLSWAKGSDPPVVRRALIDFLSESTFICPAALFAHLMELNNNSVYFYEFVHRPSNSPWPDWMGVIHFDEVQFVFGAPLRYPDKYTLEEVEFSRRIMATWVEFARKGHPSSQLSVNWPTFTSDDPLYMVLKPTNATLEYGPREANCNRWRLVLENS